MTGISYATKSLQTSRRCWTSRRGVRPSPRSFLPSSAGSCHTQAVCWWLRSQLSLCRLLGVTALCCSAEQVGVFHECRYYEVLAPYFAKARSHLKRLRSLSHSARAWLVGFAQRLGAAPCE